MADAEEKFHRYDWERWVRRVQLPPTTKLVALTMATYAAKDGSRVFPGVTRLAAVTGLSERTVRTALGNLRDVGLIERVWPGGRRGTQVFTDVHRLAIPADLMSRAEFLDPDEDVIPNRQQLPPGIEPSRAPKRQPLPDGDPSPNRQMDASQPANDDAQPANDDIPTGNGCTPTAQVTPHRSDQPTTEGLVAGTQPLTARASPRDDSATLAALIRIDEHAARKAAR